MGAWTTLVTAARDLLLAETCACCAAAVAPGPVCPPCRSDLDAAAAVPRPVRPLDPPDGFPPTLAAADYTGAVRRLLLAHKEHGRTAAAGPLGRLLAAAVATAAPPPGPSGGPPGPVLLVPIPSSPAATRRRGHDPVRRMAAVAAGTLPTDRPARTAVVLAQSRGVADQAGLSLQQRQANLAHAMTVTRPQRLTGGGWVVLVDDICSSGATLAAGAAALRAKGVLPQRIVAAVVAAPVLLRSRDRWPVRTPGSTD